MNAIFKEFGKIIEQKREKLSLTQMDISNLCSISDLTVRNIERGNRGTSIANWAKVADAVGLRFELTIKRMSDAKRESL